MLFRSDPNVAAAAGLNLSRLAEGTYWASTADDESQAFELEQVTADLSHTSAAIRQSAAIRLAMAGPAAKCASEALHAQLDDPNLVVRSAAIDAMSHWDPDRAVSLYTDLLEADGLTPILRSQVEAALTLLRPDPPPAE